MAKRYLRPTAYVPEGHPLFELLTNAERQGGKLLLAYATAWHGYSLGKGEEQPPTENAPKLKTQQDQEDELPDGFLDDALS